ncbi:MAG: DUF4350 domain-containing protein [Haloferacaceae archaeon]
MIGTRDWGWPAWLLVALVLAVGLSAVVGASTGEGAYGTFNPSWDGGSELRETIAAVGTEPYVVLAPADYDALAPADTAILVVSPTEPYDGRARDRLAAYVANGGTLVVAEDFRPHANPLLRAVGAEARVTGAPLRDDLRNTRTPAFPRATGVTHERQTADGDVANVSLTRGVDALALNHPSTVAPNGARVLVNSSRVAYVDRNRNATLDPGERLGRRPVVTSEQVGAGRVVVVSDPSLFINAMESTADNRQFVENVAAPHERVGIDETHTGGRPPLAVALVRLRRDPLLQLLVGGVGLGLVTLANRQVKTGGRRRLHTSGRSRDETEADVTGATAQRVQTALLRSSAADTEEPTDDE